MRSLKLNNGGKMKETIKKEGDKFIVITEETTDKDFLSKDYDNRINLLENYEAELKKILNPDKLSRKESQFNDLLEKLEKYRAEESHMAKSFQNVGGKDKRIKMLKEAIQLLKEQLKNREEALK